VFETLFSQAVDNRIGAPAHDDALDQRRPSLGACERIRARQRAQKDRPVLLNRPIVGGEVGARALLIDTSGRKFFDPMARRDGIR
jgi:hypothetical protein